MDELIRVLKDELGRIERKFEKMVEDATQHQSEILEALEKINRDRSTFSKAIERLERQVEELRLEVESIKNQLRHS
ncbi:MAG: hypothetical protein GXO73_00805 [Calditrichaeota bacterium]|nr:hypothetical protein [Calditrichota bacterium]